LYFGHASILCVLIKTAIQKSRKEENISLFLANASSVVCVRLAALFGVLSLACVCLGEEVLPQGHWLVSNGVGERKGGEVIMDSRTVPTRKREADSRTHHIHQFIHAGSAMGTQLLQHD
jgi:hypothetical protein